MKIDVYSQNGSKKSTLELNASVFEAKINPELIHLGYLYQLSRERIPLAHTKTRSDVRGGGRKPFRQKGTGRARQGTSRSPHQRGGGVVFGPTNKRNFAKQMPKKQRRQALFSALSAKARDHQILALDKYENDAPKTKPFAEMIKKLPIERKVLIVLPKKDLLIEQSARNLPQTKTLLVNYLNIKDLLTYEKVLFLESALKELEKVFLEKTPAPAKPEKPAKKETQAPKPSASDKKLTS